MADYRIYLLDAAERIASASSVTCDDDQGAYVHARRILGGSASKEAEVWTGDRCVGRVEAALTPTAPY